MEEAVKAKVVEIGVNSVGTPSPHSLTLAGGEEEGERKKKLRKSTHGSGAA